MTPEVRNWLTRHALVVVEGKVPIQTLLDVPKDLFSSLNKAHLHADGFQVLSVAGIGLRYWCRAHDGLPAGNFPCYEVIAQDVPIFQAKSLEDALKYIRGLVEKGLRA